MPREGGCWERSGDLEWLQAKPSASPEGREGGARPPTPGLSYGKGGRAAVGDGALSRGNPGVFEAGGQIPLLQGICANLLS